MAGKLGPGLVAACAAGVLFVAGIVMPPPVRHAVEGALAGVQAKLLQATGQASAASPAATAAGAASSPAAAPPARASSASAAAPVAATSSPTIPMASLLLPVAPPPDRRFGLQAGQFASQESANQLAASIAGQGVTSTVIVTQDRVGTTWALVSLGDFPSPEEAAAQRTYLANKLGLPDYLPTLMLPPPAAPAASAARPAP